MHTYNRFKAKMKEQAPSTWSPALKSQPQPQGQGSEPSHSVAPFGTGLEEIPHIDSEDSPPNNSTLYQCFEWYTPSWSTPIPTSPSPSTAASPSATKQPTLPSHYTVITALLPSLASLGITTIWLPPGCKGQSPTDNGYGIHDLYDLGEFETKMSRATKWGSKAELVELGRAAEPVGVGLLWDAVLNHRAAGDEKEWARAVEVSTKDRTKEIGPVREVETWSVFNYPARQGKYSSMTYNWRHFSGINWEAATSSKGIFRFVGDEHTSKRGWSTDVSDELGNYDYLMFVDVDYSQPDVQADVLNWSRWLATQVPGLVGMRLDAIKHYSAAFQYKLIKHLRDRNPTKDWFFVGEYWSPDSRFLSRYIDCFAGHMHLFDVQLMYNFSDFSQGQRSDLRKILRGSLVELKPRHAVTFVANHDTQPTQSLAAPVSTWFVPHAYALILLRTAGIPCIFHGSVLGTLGPSPSPPDAGHRIMRLCLARRLYAYGLQHDFFVASNLIAWSREGHPKHSAGAGLTVILSSAWEWTQIKVFVGRQHRGEVWADLMGWSWDQVTIDDKGWGVFRVGPRMIGVFTDVRARDRDRIETLIWPPLLTRAGEVE